MCAPLPFTKHTNPRSLQLPAASALPSSSAQVSAVQAAATVELHKQDEESGQLSSISVRHMTAKDPPSSSLCFLSHHHTTHTLTHTHTRTSQRKYKEWGSVCLFDCSEAKKLSFSPTPHTPFSVLFSAHYHPHLHARHQRARKCEDGNKIKGLKQW